MEDQGIRIDELERRIARVEKLLADQSAAKLAKPRRRTIKDFAEGPTARGLVEFIAGEGALARIGMGLLLLGVLWLVRYSIDEGWLGEWARVLLAAAAGVILLGLGRWLKGKGRVLSQVLLGGGIGALYMAAFSAHAFYGLVSFPMALALMSVVTALAFVIGLTEDSFSLASIAAAGGLSTPFLLDSGEGSVAALAAYILVIQVAVAGVYRLKTWGSTVLIAGGLTMLTLILAVIKLESEPPVADRLWLQAAITMAFMTYAVFPALRPGDPSAKISKVLTQAMAGIAPMVAWLLTVVALDLDRWPASGLALALSAGYALALARVTRNAYWYNITMFAASGLAATAVFMASDGAGIGLVSLIAVAAYYLAHQEDESDEGRFSPGHWIGSVFVLLGVFAVFRGLLEPAHASYSWPKTVYDGVAILSALACTRWSNFPRVLLAGVWLLTLLYLQREFSHVGELTGIGPAAVTMAWAVVGLVLLGAGRRNHSDRFRYAGMGTIGLVVFKLVFFDLENLDPVWRILIPMGIGGSLLVMSYLFPSWWRGESADAS